MILKINYVKSKSIQCCFKPPKVVDFYGIVIGWTTHGHYTYIVLKSDNDEIIHRKFRNRDILNNNDTAPLRIGGKFVDVRLLEFRG